MTFLVIILSPRYMWTMDWFGCAVHSHTHLTCWIVPISNTPFSVHQGTPHQYIFSVPWAVTWILLGSMATIIRLAMHNIELSTNGDTFGGKYICPPPCYPGSIRLGIVKCLLRSWFSMPVISKALPQLVSCAYKTRLQKALQLCAAGVTCITLLYL